MLPVTLLISTINLASAGFINWQEFDGPYHRNDDHHNRLKWLFFKKEDPGNHQKEYNVCRTKECFSIASEFWESMNKSVDPCENFYEYACGNWAKNNPIPPSKMTWSTISKSTDETLYKIRDLLDERIHPNDVLPVKNVKKFYQSCMDTNSIEQLGIKHLEDIFAQNEGWPMIMEPGEWDPKGFSLKQVHDYYLHLSGLAAFYKISVFYKNIMVVLPNLPSVGLESGEDFDREKMYNDGSYAKFITEVALIFASEREAQINKDQLDKDVEDIIEVEKLLGNQSESGFGFVVFEEIYEIKAYAPASKINWKKMITELFDSANIELKGDEKLYMQKNVLKTLSDLLTKRGPRSLVNYIQWHFLSYMLPYTSSKMKELQYGLKQKHTSVKSEAPRWKTCIANAKMKLAVHYMFVKKYFTEEIKYNIEKMLSAVQKEMAKYIFNADWLNDSLSKMQLKKLYKMQKNIGSPERYKNITMLNNYYRGISMGHNFLSNVLSYQKFSLKENLRSVKEDLEIDIWLSFIPNVINAFYSRKENSINFPAADFQLPFYSLQNFQTVSYGAIGFFLGHEVSHGFDDTGIRYDQDHNSTKWVSNITKWPDEMNEKYKNKRECFGKQYKDFHNGALDSSDLVLESLVLDENIADSLGLNAVFDAFESLEKKKRQPKLPGFEDLNNEQLFFLSYAHTFCGFSAPEYKQIEKSGKITDYHSERQYRVIAPLQNLEGFAKAYNCPVGSKMNPARKCKVWN